MASGGLLRGTGEQMRAHECESSSLWWRQFNGSQEYLAALCWNPVSLFYELHDLASHLFEPQFSLL